MDELLGLIRGADHAVAFSGAGVSTLSGIPDFRSPGGLYETLDPEKVFNLEYFLHDPSYYYRGMKELIYRLGDVEPNIVHRQVARLEEMGIVKAVITQNIDVLHQRAGSQNVIEVHGTPMVHHCLSCRREFEFDWVCAEVMADRVPVCVDCGGAVKPAITFFGEMLDMKTLDRATEEATRADLMLVLGSSLVVQPAASLPVYTMEGGGKIAIINRDPTPLDSFAAWRHGDLQEAFLYPAEHL